MSLQQEQEKRLAPPEHIAPDRGGAESTKEIGKEAVETSSMSEGRGVAETVSEPIANVVVSTPQRTTVYKVKSEILQKIETILEENIAEIYAELTPAQQMVVKREGEFTAKKIEELINSAKATAVKVFNLILRFFEFIPGVNKWFAEQEAKIKTDKILKLQKTKS